jgi:hypothetical protein
MRALTNAVRLVEEVVAVAQRLLCVLVDRNGDSLDVLEAMAFTRSALPQLGERVDPWRVVCLEENDPEGVAFEYEVIEPPI